MIKKQILLGLLVTLLVVGGCYVNNTNDDVTDDAKEFCINNGFDDMKFLNDRVLDGKFNCVNKSIQADYYGNIEDYYQGVVTK